MGQKKRTERGFNSSQSSKVALTVTESNRFRKSLEELYEMRFDLPVHLPSSQTISYKAFSNKV